MTRLFAAACGLALALTTAAADDKDAPALAGKWTRESSGFDLTIEYTGKDTAKFTAMAGENGAVVTVKYTADKAGLVKCKITEVKEKGKFAGAPPVGAEFSYTWKVKGDTATLDDLTGKELEHAKPVIEGDFKRAKADKK